MYTKRTLALLALAALSILVLAGCGADEGTLVVKMVDAPLDGVEQVNVNVTRVDVVLKGSGEANSAEIKAGDGVYTVYAPTTPVPINLLALQNGVSMLMGSVTLVPGDYLQLRFVVDENSTIKFLGDGTLYQLKTQSGTVTGIKIKGNGTNPLFTIADGDTSELVFDFDAALSVRTNVSKFNYILDPVIKQIQFRNQVMTSNDFTCEK